jgi:uncharacterized protein YrrD
MRKGIPRRPVLPARVSNVQRPISNFQLAEQRLKIINQHLGLPVICLETSERVGDVVRFVTDHVTGRIVAVAVRRKWYLEPAGVAFSDCAAFGQNVVLIRRMDALQPLSQMEDASLYLETSTDARQRTAITEGGRLLGSVTDEGFDETTGEITGYRLDVMADTGTGRTVYIPHAAFVTSSATVAILRDDVLNDASDTLEGLTQTVPAETGEADALGAWRGADDLIQATPAEVTAPAAEPDLADSLDAAAEEMQPEAAAVAPDQEALFADMEPAPLPEEEPETPLPASSVAPQTLTEDDAPDAPAAEDAARSRAEGHDRVMMALSLGRVAGSTLSDASGAPFVEPGQTITLEIAQAAARAGRLYELWSSTQGEAEN